MSECAAGCDALKGSRASNTDHPAPDSLLSRPSPISSLPITRRAPSSTLLPPPPSDPAPAPPGLARPLSHPAPLPSQALGAPSSRAGRRGHDPLGACEPARCSPGPPSPAPPPPAAAPGPFPARTRFSSLRPQGQALLRSPPRPGPRRAPDSPGRGPRPSSQRRGLAAAAPPASASPAFPGPRPAQATPGFYCSVSPSRWTLFLQLGCWPVIQERAGPAVAGNAGGLRPASGGLLKKQAAFLPRGLWDPEERISQQMQDAAFFFPASDLSFGTPRERRKRL